MSDYAIKWLSFGIAGVTLIAVADAYPRVAVWTAGILALGVALSHSGEIATLLGNWQTAVSGG